MVVVAAAGEVPEQVPVAHLDLPRLPVQQGRVDEALGVQMALADHPERQGNPAEGYTHEEIGECLLLLNQPDAAAQHFAIAYARLSTDPWLEANEPERLKRLQQLSQ